MIYAVYLNKAKEVTMERYEERTWELMKTLIPHVYYVSMDIADPEFIKYDIQTIVWDRIYNPMSHNKERIVVPYLPENISEMEKASDVVMAKKEEIFKEWNDNIREQKNKKFDAMRPQRNANRDEKIEAILENDKLFEGEMSEYEILSKWKNLGFLYPPPTKVVNIKREYNKSWSDFKEIVKQLTK